MNTISQTANEAIARRIVDRLCRRPPYGQAWRDYAIREISGALAAEALRRRREGAGTDPYLPGGANAAATG
jgi:hypothetical protein